MNVKKWVIISATIGAAATIAALAAFTNPVRVFRTYASVLGVSQGQNLQNQPQYVYTPYNGADLVGLALGASASSNQVFAMEVDCGSSQADLVVFDKLTSNLVTVATSTNFFTVKNQGLKAKYVDGERFVAQFNVEAVGNLVRGNLMVAGRLHLGTNGCPQTVLLKLDRDPKDKRTGDVNLYDKTDKTILVVRAGQAHLIGWVDVVANSQTNTVLLPFGRLTFAHKLDQFTAQ